MNKAMKIMTAALIAAAILVCEVPEAASAAGDPFEGKKVLIEGDSIQDRHWKKWGESPGYFLHKAAKRLGMKVTNNAIASSTLSRKYRKSVYRRIMAMKEKDLAKYDYVFISAGTNDYGDNAGGRATVKRVKKDLKLIIKRIRKYNSKAKIVIVSPLRRYRIRNYATGDCDRMKNRVDNATLADYRKAIEKVAKSYSDKDVYCISGKKLASLSEIKKYTVDYLHPRYSFAKKKLATRAKKILKKMFI